jgi:hypothetical protein
MLAACVALAGCTSPTVPDDDPRAQLAAAQRLWRSQGFDSYGYNYQNVCFCLESGPVRITVLRGRKASIQTEDGQAVEPDHFGRYRTVEEAFALIEDAFARNAAQVRAEYDPRFGHPVDVFIDYSLQMADEEQGLQISGLVPLRE